MTFSLFFATIFMFAGTGYNIIQYCCDDCRNLGIEMASEMSCESIHHHHYEADMHANNGASCTMTCVHELTKGCDIDRLTVDIPSVQAPQNELTDYSLMFVQLADYMTGILPVAEVLSENEYAHTPPDIPPYQPEGRQILSNISILRI